MFRSIVFSAVVVGIVAGIAVSLMQMVGTTPLILQAETYENAAAVTTDADPAAQPHAHAHGTAADAHEDEGGGWAPADGLQRTASTMAANVLTAIGYSLVITGLLSAVNAAGGWRTGLMFGLAGFASVMLAPMIGLPPELPGTPAADLGARQIWWVATAALTACGIALLAYRPKPWMAAVAILIIAAPHVVGAPPAPTGEHALAPVELERRFAVAATVTSFVFWALLGSLSGVFLKRFAAAR